MRPTDASDKAFGAALAVHSALGPGLLESAYEKALCREFTKCGLRHRRQVRVPIEYDGVRIDNAFVADFILETASSSKSRRSRKCYPVNERSCVRR